MPTSMTSPSMHSHSSHIPTDRNANNKIMHTSSPVSKMLLTPPSSRPHSHHQTYSHSSASASMSHSHHHSTPLSYSSNSSLMNTPSKYDLSHGSPHIHSASTAAAAVAASNGYLHPNSMSQSMYGNSVKTESSANYDYMNNCIQNGYFGSSFGSSVTGGHGGGVGVSSDLAGYHHQHNVIQAAKLMASS